MKRALVAAALASTTLLTACGGGSGLNDEQKKLAEKVHAEAGISSKQAECLIGKLKDDEKGYDSIKHDANLSEQEGEGGSAVAAAFADCSDGKTFSEVFGYDPD